MRYTPINQFFVLFFLPACIYCFIFLPLSWNSLFSELNKSLDNYGIYINIISHAANADAQHVFFRTYLTIPLGILFSSFFILSLFKFNKQKNIQWAIDIPRYFSKKLIFGQLWIAYLMAYNLFSSNQDYGYSSTGHPNLVIVSGSELLVMVAICYSMGYFAVLALRREKNE